MPMHGSKPVPDRWAALDELSLTRHLHRRRVLEVGSVRVYGRRAAAGECLRGVKGSEAMRSQGLLHSLGSPGLPIVCLDSCPAGIESSQQRGRFRVR